MKVAFLKESLKSIERSKKKFDDKIDSLLLMYEAFVRKYEVYHFTPEQLMLDGDGVYARAQKLNHIDMMDRTIRFGKKTILNLEDVDAVIIRLDPPFNMNYITATYILDRIKDKTLVVNSPSGIRNFAEKLFPFPAGDLSPPTVITSYEPAIVKFRERHGDIIIKPLYAYGGQGVLFIKKDDKNFASSLELLQERYKLPMVVQKFIPEVEKEGDKRIFIMNGEPLAAYIRTPDKGSVRSNLSAGGTVKEAKLDKHDYKICEKIIPELKKRDILVAGVDTIGGLVTEINVTSPAGFYYMEIFSGTNLKAKFWDIVKKKC